jgi:hypothetical protein
MLYQMMELVDFTPLWVQIPTGTFMWGSYQASLWNVGGSIQVAVRAWNNARRSIWGLPPPVKLERRDMTYTVSMWRKPSQDDGAIILHLLLPSPRYVHVVKEAKGIGRFTNCENIVTQTTQIEAAFFSLLSSLEFQPFMCPGWVCLTH